MRADRPRLRFRSNRTFTIVQLTDLHWSNGNDADARTRVLVNQVLGAERPDLVVLTGDVVNGATARDPRAAWHDVAGIVEAHGTPWAAVFGNHDDEGSASREELLRAQRRHPLCLSTRGPRRVTGVGNYMLPVRSGRTGRLAAALYFLDSNAYDPRGLGHYAWIGYDQIGWYRATAARLTRELGQGKGPPALAFFHIPLPEWDELWRTRVCRGQRREPVCAPAVNSGFFSALVETDGMLGAFCGHDHLNDYEGELYGIRLGYGRATGFGTYGRKGFARGARVIRLHEGRRSLDTWLRIEGGVRIDPPVHQPGPRRG
jgi:hypothetical protein